MRGPYSTKRLISAEIGQAQLRKVDNIFKGRNGRRFSYSEIIRQALREAVLNIKNDGDAVGFLERARVNDVQEYLQEGPAARSKTEKEAATA